MIFEAKKLRFLYVIVMVFYAASSFAMRLETVLHVDGNPVDKITFLEFYADCVIHLEQADVALEVNVVNSTKKDVTLKCKVCERNSQHDEDVKQEIRVVEWGTHVQLKFCLDEKKTVHLTLTPSRIVNKGSSP